MLNIFDGVYSKLPVEYISNVDKKMDLHTEMLDLHPKKTISELLSTKEVHTCQYSVFLILLLLICTNL